MENLLSIENMIWREAEDNALSQTTEKLEIFLEVLQSMIEHDMIGRINIEGCTDNAGLMINTFFERARVAYCRTKAEEIYDDMVHKLLEKVLPENFGPENLE